jgi:hypothetical protein
MERHSHKEENEEGVKKRFRVTTFKSSILSSSPTSRAQDWRGGLLINDYEW